MTTRPTVNLTCSPYQVMTPQIPQEPKRDCRAYFTGLLVGDKYSAGNVSVAYKVDDYSEYVGAGSYPKNSQAFPKSVATTFDGIAIDRYTRVIIWEKENFQGNILLDQVGPAIINNVLWKDRGSSFPQYVETMTKTFDDPDLQKNFPQNVRQWSISDMHAWSNGSLKVVGADIDGYNDDYKNGYNNDYNADYGTGYNDEQTQVTMANIRTNMASMNLKTQKAKVILSYLRGQNKYEFVIEPDIFASGAFKNAYKGKLISSHVTSSHAPKIANNTSVVLKVKKRGPSMFRGDWNTELYELKKLAKYCKEWNNNKYSDKTYTVSNAFVLKVDIGGSIFAKGEYVLIEPYLPTFVKWNWPQGAEQNARAYSIQAFGHFTYHYSNGKQLVNDAQGYRGDNKYVLTDPYYLHLSSRNGAAWNAHIQWFQDHKCNKFCKSHWKTPDGVNKSNLNVPSNTNQVPNNGIKPTQLFF